MGLYQRLLHSVSREALLGRTANAGDRIDAGYSVASRRRTPPLDRRDRLLRTPLLPLDVNGAGDAIAALFLYHRLHSGSEVVALEAAGSAIHGLLRLTAAAGSREILTVAAQEEFVAPGVRFLAEPC